MPAKDVTLPNAVAALPGVRVATAKAANGHDLIVGTLNKLGDAFARGDLAPFDLLFVDEAYQADSAKYFTVGGLAPRHLLVGDPGQINPFATVADPGRWRGLPEDPLQTAVGVLLRNHPLTPVHGLPVTRRLDPRAATVAQHFYPDLTFRPAVLPGVRELQLGRGVSDTKSGRSVTVRRRQPSGTRPLRRAPWGGRPATRTAPSTCR